MGKQKAREIESFADASDEGEDVEKNVSPTLRLGFQIVTIWQTWIFNKIIFKQDEEEVGNESEDSQSEESGKANEVAIWMDCSMTDSH